MKSMLMMTALIAALPVVATAEEAVPMNLPTLDGEPRYVPESFYETGDQVSCVVWYDCCTMKCPPDYAPDVPKPDEDGQEVIRTVAS